MGQSSVFPKPAAGAVPIALGDRRPLGMDHAAEYADHWMPIDQYLTDNDGNRDVAAGHRAIPPTGRHARPRPDDVPVSQLLFSRPNASRIEHYAELGVKRLVASVPSADFVGRDLDAGTPLIE